MSLSGEMVSSTIVLNREDSLRTKNHGLGLVFERSGLGL